MLRRWLLILVMLIVPAQVVWAAAARYCGHETQAAAKKHLGHHEHRHQADTAPAADAAEVPGAPVHADCQVCHLGGSILIPALPAVCAGPPSWPPPGAPVPGYRSHVPAAPEPPDWAAPAAAARFDGAVGASVRAG